MKEEIKCQLHATNYRRIDIYDTSCQKVNEMKVSTIHLKDRQFTRGNGDDKKMIRKSNLC